MTVTPTGDGTASGSSARLVLTTDTPAWNSSRPNGTDTTLVGVLLSPGTISGAAEAVEHDTGVDDVPVLQVTFTAPDELSEPK